MQGWLLLQPHQPPMKWSQGSFWGRQLLQGGHATIWGAGMGSAPPELLEQFHESPCPAFLCSPPICHGLAARQSRE